MDPELPKALARAVDLAKKLSVQIEESVKYLLELKSNLEMAHPALNQLHQNIVAGTPIPPSEPEPEQEPQPVVDAPDEGVPDHRYKSGFRPSPES